MLALYQDTKMSVAGISYTIPKSFYIVVDEFIDVKNNGLVFTTQEKNCRIEVFTVKSDITFNVQEDFISSICDNSTFTVHGKVDERLENHMYSIRAEFESRRHSYFEMHIGQRKGYDERVELLITVERDKSNIGEVLKREDVKRFIDSFEFTE